MNQKTNLLVAISCIFVLCLSGCRDFVKDTPTYDSCLGSFKKYAYTSAKQEEFGIDSLPTAPWQMETTLPEIKADQFISSKVSISRIHNQQKEIWIKRFPSGGIPGYEDSISLFTYAVYYPDTGEWKSVRAEIDGSRVFAGQLFVTSDGTIWANNAWYFLPKLAKRKPYLSKYNEETTRFEFVETEGKFSSNWGNDIATIILDQNDVFWLFAPGDGIYSYDPAAREEKLHLSLMNFDFFDVSLTRDGNFYLYKALEYSENSVLLQENEIFYFDTKQNELEPISIPRRRWLGVGGILEDSQGRLWIGSVGYRDVEETWNLIYPNSLDYFSHLTANHNYRSEKAHIIMESSNGWLWYWRYAKGRHGLAWLDPESGEGCWFTTESLFSSPLIEDGEHVMWMATRDSLFKFPLDELE